MQYASMTIYTIVVAILPIFQIVMFAVRRLALLTCLCHFVKVEHGDNKLTKVNETRLKADVTQGKDNNLQTSECRSFVGQNVYFTIMTMSICCSASSQPGKNIDKFASMAIHMSLEGRPSRTKKIDGELNGFGPGMMNEFTHK